MKSTHPGPASHLPHIAGVDTVSALRRAAGNRELYFRMLRQFVDQQQQAAVTMAGMLSAGQQEAAQILAHSIKGTAGTLGAMAVWDVAAKLETVIETGSPTSAALQALDRELRKLKSAVDAALPAPVVVVAGAGSGEVGSIALQQLLQMLADDDGEAINFFALHRDDLQRKLGWSASEVARAIDNCQFAQARELIEKIKP